MNIRRHFATHKRKVLLFSPVIIFLLIGPGFIFDWSNIDPPAVTLEPETIAVNPGEEFTVRIQVNATQAVNAFDIRLDFPTAQLDAVSAVPGEDIVDLWISKPATHNASGTVTMIGGSTHPGGWRGSGTLATVIFHARESGQTTLRLGSAVILAHDGKGTDTLATTTDAGLIVHTIAQGGSTVLTSRADTTYLIRSEIPPPTDLTSDGKTTISDLSAFLSRDDSTYDSKKDFNQDGTVNLKDMSILFSAIVH